MVKRLDAARPIMERFIAAQVTRAGDRVEAKTVAIRNVTRVLAKVENPARRALYVRQLADLVDMEREIIDQAVQHARIDSVRLVRRPWMPERRKAANATERALAQLVFQFPAEALSRLRAETIEQLADEQLKQILRVCVDYYEKNGRLDPAAVANRFEDPALQSLTCDVSAAEPPADDDTVSRVLDDCLFRIEKTANTRKRKCLLDSIAEAEKSGDREGVRRLQSELRGMR